MIPKFSWSEHTCGEACWHAVDDVCRCSCGGKNHGCLRGANGVQPARMAKIGGHRYKLAMVGDGAREYGCEVNRQAGFRSVEPARLVDNGDGKAWWHQYSYTWETSKDGSPARVKPATFEQIQKWPELSAWRHLKPWENRPELCWVREVMPERAGILVVDEKTGEPLADQLPARCW